MTTALKKGLEQLKALPSDAQEAIAHDLLEMIRSERKRARHAYRNWRENATR